MRGCAEYPRKPGSGCHYESKTGPLKRYSLTVGAALLKNLLENVDARLRRVFAQAGQRLPLRDETRTEDKCRLVLAPIFDVIKQKIN